MGRIVRGFGLLAAVTASLVVAVGPVAAVEAPPGVTPAPNRQASFAPAQSSGEVVGRLVVPAIGLDEVIRSGVAPEVIDRGVGHWVGTSLPGGPGNVVLAGHRTTHTAPFRDLDRLQPGDLVVIERPGLLPAVYRVVRTFVVEPSDVWITYEFGRPMVTMFACHPKGSARFRIVVQADLVTRWPMV